MRLTLAQQAKREENSRRHLEGRRLDRLANIERFAEALANCGDVAEASKQVGVTVQTGFEYLRVIRDKLGPQAV